MSKDGTRIGSLAREIALKDRVADLAAKLRINSEMLDDQSSLILDEQELRKKAEAELAAERERLDATKREVDAALDCYKSALNAMRKDWREMFESTQAAGVELAAERERREAAERLLHDYAALANDAMRAANYSGAEYDRDEEMADYHSYVARYEKD